jgi:predicted dehydrogenase
MIATAPLPTSTATAAVRPVRLVLLGVNFGALIARNLASGTPHIELAGLCDLDLPRVTALAAELQVPTYASLDEVLADPTVEAVGLFTGPAGRARLIERILDAGKHVMTTKPFEVDTNEAIRAFAAAERTGLALHLNSPGTKPASDLAIMRRWLAEADLGRPVALQARTWANYHEKADGGWADDPKRCPGGALFRLGVYLMNEFASLPGRPTSAYVQHARLRTGRPTPDNAQISIAYDTGAVANIFASFCVNDGHPYADEIHLACERGVIRRWVERTGKSDMSGDHAVVELVRPGQPVERHETKPGDFAGWYDWIAFHDAVRGLPGAIRHNAEVTLTGVRLLSAMSRSIASSLPEAL